MTTARQSLGCVGAPSATSTQTTIRRMSFAAGWSVGVQELRDSAASSKRWVAVDKDRVVGFCEHNLSGELSRIYVHRDYLRRGIGSRLLAVAETSLARHGCRESPCRIDNHRTEILRVERICSPQKGSLQERSGSGIQHVQENAVTSRSLVGASGTRTRISRLQDGGSPG